MGGTFLGSNNKGNTYGTILENGKKIRVFEKTMEGYKSLQLDALIGIGGDGSLKILQNLTKKGNINFGQVTTFYQRMFVGQKTGDS